MASIRDVAAMAKVSVGTVSMVLNNSNRVSTAKQILVKEAIERLDYHRNPYGRSLSLNRSHCIGLIVTDLTNPFFGMIVGHLQRDLDDLGYHLMLGMSENSTTLENKLAQNLVDAGVDGLFIVPAHERISDASHNNELPSRNVPIVYLTSHYPGIEKNCVMADLESGSYQMARFLLESGHSGISMISGYRGVIISEMRINGFLRAHHEIGLRVESWQIKESDPVFGGGYRATEELLVEHRPDAIMTMNDIMSMGVLSYLQKVGVSVPDEISVVGYDDQIFSEMLQTPLTTIRQPINEICSIASELMVSLINGGREVATPILLQPEVIIRKSTQAKIIDTNKKSVRP